MDQQRLAILLEKLAQGLISPDERMELDNWYSQVAYQDAEFPDEENAVQQRLLNRFAQQTRKPKKKMHYGWYAAASIVVAVLGGFYFYANVKRPGPSAPQVARNQTQNITPGSNKATLTIAGGRQIVLDSNSNGRHIAQAGSTATPTADNGLVYTADPNAAPSISFNTLTTPRGGQYNLTLPDGTQVWLNAASSLTYPTAFTAGERQVKLSGEAYFEVARDPAKPFMVDVNGRQQVLVLGTHLNIQAYPEEDLINTTLLEGAIKVISDQRSLIMKPGEMVINDGTAPLRAERADEEAVMAWRNGVFVFNEESIRTAMRKAARWYDIEVEFHDGVEKKRIGGVISRDRSITELLDKIARTDGIHYQIRGKKVILMK